MDTNKKYFSSPTEVASTSGAYLELRSSLAWQLIQHFGAVAGKIVRRELCRQRQAAVTGARGTGCAVLQDRRPVC